MLCRAISELVIYTNEVMQLLGNQEEEEDYFICHIHDYCDGDDET